MSNFVLYSLAHLIKVHWLHHEQNLKQSQKQKKFCEIHRKEQHMIASVQRELR